MHVGRVVGRVISTIKDETLVGKKLLILQPMSAEGEDVGDRLVSVDAVGAGAGELVFYVRGKEAGFHWDPVDVTADACVVGILDALDPDEAPLPRVDAANWPFPGATDTDSPDDGNNNE